MSRILFGVTGSIAAYRAPDVVKALVAQGHEVQALLTQSAQQFTTPKTLETFSGKKVLSNDQWSDEHEGTDHIRHARWADLFVVYGATANFLAKIANGFCDDFLSLQIMATKAPVLLVPAMNVEMWENPANQENVQKLRARGYIFVGPIAGLLACGEEGLGHVANTDDLLMAVKKVRQKKQSYYFAKRVLLSLGAMKTDIDDVRFVQNKSSGLMGLAVAEALREAGAEVHLLAGLLSPSVENEVKKYSVSRYQSYSEYRIALQKLWPDFDAFYSLAAVLDFEVIPAEGKIERGTDSLSLKLKATEDMVAWAADNRSEGKDVVAFSLESGATWKECLERAHKKLLKKAADLIVVNRAGLSDQGPDASENALYLLDPASNAQELKRADKREIARELVTLIARHYSARRPQAFKGNPISLLNQ